MINLKQFAEERLIYLLDKFTSIRSGILFLGPPEICFIKLLSLFTLTELSVLILSSKDLS